MFRKISTQVSIHLFDNNLYKWPFLELSNLPYNAHLIQLVTLVYIHSSSTSTLSDSSPVTHNQSLTMNCQPSFNQFTNNRTDDSFTGTTLSRDLVPIQPVSLDHDDLPGQTDNLSYVNLRPCFLNHDPQKSEVINQASSNNDEQSNEKLANRGFDTNKTPVSPIVALRQVVHGILSEDKKQQSSATNNQKVVRGSRLKSIIGLNITEDEYVLSKLKENQAKKNRTTKMRNSKENGKNILKTHRKTDGKREKQSTINIEDEESVLKKDIDIERAPNALQNVIDYSRFSDAEGEEC